MKEWIVGRNPVYEVMNAGRRQAFRLQVARGVEERGRLVDILNLAQKKRLPIERVDRAQLNPYGENPQGVAVEVSGYPYMSLQDILDLAVQRQEPLFVLILDVIQDPQNLGTLLRTAEAVGVHGVLMPLRRAAEVTPAVVRASAGASEHLFIVQSNLAQAIASLKEAGAWVIGLEGGPGSIAIEQARLDGALALVVGNEGEGLRALVAKSCDLLVSLPMVGKVEIAQRRRGGFGGALPGFPDQKK